MRTDRCPAARPNREAAFRLLSTAYEPEDWIAVLLKASGGQVLQRVAPVAAFKQPRWQTWLRAMNEIRFNVYVSLNAVQAGRRERTKAAIRSIRNIVLDVDDDAGRVLASLKNRRDLPPASFIVHSSANRAHVLWRVSGFTVRSAEDLQKHLARELGTDTAATSASQLTRLPGFLNHKYSPPQLVTVEFRPGAAVHSPSDFPSSAVAEKPAAPQGPNISAAPRSTGTLRRARRYVSAVPPAIAGQHGDLRTFRICCRLARGFALDDARALNLLAEWNARCEPPWSERDLIEKLRRARCYGREPIGGLLEARR